MERDIFELNSKVLVVNLELLEILGGVGHLNEALVLQQIDYWLNVSKKEGMNYINGYYWYYSSVLKMWEKDFKYCFSLKTLKRILITLEEKNYLITFKKFNAKYYRINYDKINKYFNICSESGKKLDEPVKTLMLEKDNRISEKPLGQNDPTSWDKMTQL